MLRDLLREYNLQSGTQRKSFCRAPFNSMRISQDGRVFVCNHNTQYLLGRFPEQSVMEIWTGRPIRKLRKYLGKNDLSHGCGRCEDDVLQQRFAQGSFVMFDRFPEQKMPSRGT